MAKLPKRMQKSHANVDRVKFYPVDEAVKHKHEYVTLEHLLYALLEDNSARDILSGMT